MKKLKLLFVFTFFLGLSSIFAQTVDVSGMVTDESGRPLSGVVVSVKDYPFYTVTDANGEFSMNVPESASTLVFIKTGYVTQESDIDNFIRKGSGQPKIRLRIGTS